MRLQHGLDGRCLRCLRARLLWPELLAMRLRRTRHLRRRSGRRRHLRLSTGLFRHELPDSLHDHECLRNRLSRVLERPCVEHLLLGQRDAERDRLRSDVRGGVCQRGLECEQRLRELRGRVLRGVLHGVPRGCVDALQRARNL